MEWFDWFKFVALFNMVAFLWFFHSSMKKGAPAVGMVHVLQFKGGPRWMQAWWASFLLCLSYRIGASATVSPEAVIYGLLPAGLIALIFLEYAKSRAREFEVVRQQRAKEAAKSARPTKHRAKPTQEALETTEPTSESTS